MEFCGRARGESTLLVLFLRESYLISCGGVESYGIMGGF